MEMQPKLDQENFEIPPCTLTRKVNYEDFPWGAHHLNLADPIRVARCRDTGMLYLCPRPSRKNRELMLQGIMPDALREYGTKVYTYASVDEMRMENFEHRVDQFNRLFMDNDEKILLDVGTSGGAFLDAAVKGGWQVKGIEPFADDVRKCREKGHNVVQGMAEELPYDDNTFHVVHTSHVFEHLDDPLVAAKEALRVLKPGGLLFIEVPNQLDNFGFRRDMFFGNVSQRKRGITSIHHLWFFGRKSLALLLTNAGFENVEIKNRFASPAKGWRYPFSLLSHLLGHFFYGAYIINGYGFKRR